MFFVSCVSDAFSSVQCCLEVTCWEKADLLALFGDVYCIFVTFPCGILGQVCYLIVSFPDLFFLSYFYKLVPKCRVLAHIFCTLDDTHRVGQLTKIVFYNTWLLTYNKSNSISRGTEVVYQQKHKTFAP